MAEFNVGATSTTKSGHIFLTEAAALVFLHGLKSTQQGLGHIRRHFRRDKAALSECFHIFSKLVDAK